LQLICLICAGLSTYLQHEVTERVRKSASSMQICEITPLLAGSRFPCSTWS